MIHGRPTELCINCHTPAHDALKPVCGHVVCSQCVNIQCHVLPRLAAKGLYICYECGDKILLPPGYFVGLRRPEPMPQIFRERLSALGGQSHHIVAPPHRTEVRRSLSPPSVVQVRSHSHGPELHHGVRKYSGEVLNTTVTTTTGSVHHPTRTIVHPPVATGIMHELPGIVTSERSTVTTRCLICGCLAPPGSSDPGCGCHHERVIEERHQHGQEVQVRHEETKVKYEVDRQTTLNRLEKERLDRLQFELRGDKDRILNEKDRLAIEKERLARLEMELLEKQRSAAEKLDLERRQFAEHQREIQLRREQEDRERLIKFERDRQELAAQAERERHERERLDKERQHQWSEMQRLEQERLRGLAEKERIERDRIEKERQLQWAEKQKLEQERLREAAERDRLEKERQREASERERLEKERQREWAEREMLHREKLEREVQDRERHELERIERDRQERERQQRLDREAERQRQLENERLERERLEKNRLATERLEKERLLQERALFERERQEKDRLDRERQEAQDRAHKDRMAKMEALERELLDRLKKDEQDRISRLEKEDRERLAKQEREDRDHEREERERLARIEREEKERKDRIEREERDRKDRIEREEKERKDRIEREDRAREAADREYHIQREKELAEKRMADELSRQLRDREWQDRLEKDEQLRLEHEKEWQERLDRDEQLRLEREKEREKQDREDRERREERERLDREERKVKEEIERKEKSAKEERDRKEKQEREDREKAEREAREERERQERAAREDRERDEKKARAQREREEQEARLERERQENAKKEREQQEFDKHVKDELLRIEISRDELERMESERRERERVEHEKIESERAETKRIQGLLKNTHIIIDGFRSSKNRTLGPFKTLDEQRPFRPDQVPIKIPDSSQHQRRSDLFKKSKPKNLSRSTASHAEQPNRPSYPEHSIKLPVSVKLAQISRTLGDLPSRPERDIPSRAERDLGSSVGGRSSDKERRPHYLDINPLDYDSNEEGARELRERIEQELRKRPNRPVHNRERSLTPEEYYPRERSKSQERPYSGHGVNLRREPEQTAPRVQFNPILSASFKPEAPKYVRPEIFTQQPLGAPKENSALRERFLKTKSMIKLDMEANPRLYPKHSDASTYDGALSTGGRGSSGNRGRGSECDGLRSSFYETNRSMLTKNLHTHCKAHSSKACCGKWDIVVQAGKHCCHCFLIKSDLHNSNHKYNAALVSLNTGSVLRTLIKESHCEDNH